MIKKIRITVICYLGFLLICFLLEMAPLYFSVPVAVAADKTLEHNIKILRDKNVDLHKRLEAAQNLGKMKSPRAIRALIKAAQKDSNNAVRSGAAETLGRTGQTAAVDFLIAGLKKEKLWIVRGGMVRGLTLSGDPRVFATLVRTLESDTNIFVRKEAARSLGKLGDRRAIEPLIMALRDEGVVIHAKHGEDNMTVTRDVVQAAVVALREFDVTVSKDSLAFDWIAWDIHRLKEHQDEDERAITAWRLGMSKSSKAVAPLITALLNDPHVDVRRNAAKSLSNLGDRRAVGPLIKAMESDKKYWGRISAARALGILGGKRAVRAIQKAIQDKKISPKALKDTLEKLGIQ